MTLLSTYSSLAQQGGRREFLQGDTWTLTLGCLLCLPHLAIKAGEARNFAFSAREEASSWADGHPLPVTPEGAEAAAALEQGFVECFLSVLSHWASRKSFKHSPETLISNFLEKPVSATPQLASLPT